MTILAQIGYGAIGGFVGWVVVFALPELKAMWHQRELPTLDSSRLIVAALICGAFVIIGAGAAPIFGAGEGKEAVLYGLAGESLFAGVIKTAA